MFLQTSAFGSTLKSGVGHCLLFSTVLSIRLQNGTTPSKSDSRCTAMAEEMPTELRSFAELSSVLKHDIVLTIIRDRGFLWSIQFRSASCTTYHRSQESWLLFCIPSFLGRHDARQRPRNGCPARELVAVVFRSRPCHGVRYASKPAINTARKEIPQ